MDMDGFKPSLLPHIKSAIDVLRSHYPGRLGCACFINTPGYFYPVWKIIGPWLDAEILTKTFFLPKVREAAFAFAGHFWGLHAAAGWLLAFPHCPCSATLTRPFARARRA